MKLIELKFFIIKKLIISSIILCSINMAQGVINVSVSYSVEGDFTTLEVTGEWDDFEFSNNFAATIVLLLDSDRLITVNGSYDFSGGGVYHVSGDMLPTATGLGVVGDSWGFRTNAIWAPPGYEAGDPITSTAFFVGDVFDITTTPSQEGVYAGNGNTVIWSTVPETSTYAALLGIATLGLAWLRRLN